MSEPWWKIPEEFHGSLALIVASITGGVLTVSKMLRVVKADRKSIADEDKEIAEANAESDVINLLRAEVHRLSLYIGQLHDTIDALRQEVGELRAREMHLTSLIENGRHNGSQKDSGAD